MSPKKKRTLKMDINHREVQFPEGVTVLRAAELNDIYIPSLCSHKDLSPFGGCRICLVEVEGMRGYPLACSTIAEAGMKILTDTAAIRARRKEVLQLILSEHPLSCLICADKDECRENQYTIRKAGVTTGCRFCPSDDQCELQEVVEKIGVTEVDYPIYYRGNEIEHDDPFFDRDYNICILCGRCVRMCQEVRGTSILAFKFRGPQIQIGPSYGRSHMEAGCEFCGACVSVCPTGTLADKVSKWDGEPDGFEISTCPFCGIGCQIELFHKEGRLSKVHPNLDPEINDGQLCVRGRFSLPETTHHHERAKKPMLMRGKFFREVTWEESLDEVADKLKGLGADDFLMVVSGDLTNESLYTAQKFVRTCLGSNNIDSTARYYLPGGPELWAKLFSLPVSIKGIKEAESIIVVNLDSRFSFSIAGVEIRRALKEGANLVVIDPRESNLSRYTNHWLRPAPGKEGAVLNLVAKNLGKKKIDESVSTQAGVEGDLLQEAVDALSAGQNLAVVVGPQAFEYSANEELVDALSKLARRENTIFLPLYYGTNTRGAFELGAMNGILPGVAKARGSSMSLDDLLDGKAKPKVTYLVGEAPFFERPDCEFVIAQGIYYPPFKVDAFLPASSFAEAEGTLTNVEGRVQSLVRIENLPDGALNGYSRPDWEIFSRLARKLKSTELKYRSSKGILREISQNVPGFPSKPDRKPRKLEPASKFEIKKRKNGVSGTGTFLLVAESAGFRHRAIDLSSKVEGLGELALEEGFHFHPSDLEKLKVEAGGNVVASIDGLEITGPAKAHAECPEGVVYFFRPHAFGGIEHRADLEPLFRMTENPLNVEVRAAKPSGKKVKAKAASKK